VKINLSWLWFFYIVENKAREGRNPSTGEPLKIEASKLPKFKAGSDLKKACNK